MTYDNKWKKRTKDLNHYFFKMPEVTILPPEIKVTDQFASLGDIYSLCIDLNYGPGVDLLLTIGTRLKIKSPVLQIQQPFEAKTGTKFTYHTICLVRNPDGWQSIWNEYNSNPEK